MSPQASATLAVEYYNGRDMQVIRKRIGRRFQCYLLREPREGEWPNAPYHGKFYAVVEAGGHGVGCGHVPDPGHYGELLRKWAYGVRALLAWDKENRT